LSKSAPNGNIGDFFENILKIFFGLFRGLKLGPPTPVRGSGFGVKSDPF
jgi:hypothetical protein